MMIWRCDLVPQYMAYASEIDEAIKRVLGTGRYVLADEVANFEQEFVTYVGTRYAVGVANGTDALIVALKAFGVGIGDEVITTPYTAIPTISAIVAAGAKPVFTDVDQATFLMDIEQIPQLLSPRTKAIIPVHIFGNMVDIERLRALLPRPIPILEDAAQAHGSTLRGRQAGSMGEASAFSFYPTKNLGGYGDGGAIVTDDAELAHKLKLLRMYGMTDKDHIVIHGVNTRLDEIQAAILSIKLRYLDEMNRRRNTLAAIYCSRLNAQYFSPQQIPQEVFCNFHVFTARFHGDRRALMAYLDQEGIQTNIYYLLPLHLQEANAHLGYRRGDLPRVEALCDEVIALPMYAEFPVDTLEFVIERLNRFCTDSPAA